MNNFFNEHRPPTADPLGLGRVRMQNQFPSLGSCLVQDMHVYCIYIYMHIYVYKNINSCEGDMFTVYVCVLYIYIYIIHIYI